VRINALDAEQASKLGLIVTALILLVAGVGLGPTLLWVGLSVVVLTVGIVATEWIRLRTTTYRLDETRIERRTVWDHLRRDLDGD
jgi:uncharacterized membrane protein YdbT with pleckstrin-like domain